MIFVFFPTISKFCAIFNFAPDYQHFSRFSIFLLILNFNFFQIFDFSQFSFFPQFSIFPDFNFSIFPQFSIFPRFSIFPQFSFFFPDFHYFLRFSFLPNFKFCPNLKFFFLQKLGQTYGRNPMTFAIPKPLGSLLGIQSRTLLPFRPKTKSKS